MLAAKLTALKGIGTVMSEKLNAAGITSAEELTRIGSKAAFARIKKVHPRACLVHLYTLQAAIDGVDIALLPVTVKQDLKAFSDSLK